MTQEKAPAFGKRLVPLARSVRNAGYRALAPLDYAFRVMSHLKQYPPLHLRRHVGGMSAGFNGPGYEFVAYLRLLAGLRDGDLLWDLACGCGLLELALEDLGWQGKLTGTDISKPCIDWAQKNIAARVAGYKFVHMDIYNEAYQRTGKLTTQAWLDHFTGNQFDVVIAKSLFTHVLPDEQTVYLKAIADRLNPGGRALLTFFVLSEDRPCIADSGKDRMLFQAYSEDERCSVYRPLAPHAAVAYKQQYLEERFRDAGFKMQSYKHYPGAWTGNPDGLSFQDIIVAER
jgi:SAM-dependent methyltransferase